MSRTQKAADIILDYVLYPGLTYAESAQNRARTKANTKKSRLMPRSFDILLPYPVYMGWYIGKAAKFSQQNGTPMYSPEFLTGLEIVFLVCSVPWFAINGSMALYGACGDICNLYRKAAGTATGKMIGEKIHSIPERCAVRWQSIKAELKR